MRYLFVHQNFPGQYLHFVRHLVTDSKNDIVFISEPNQNHVVGVRRVSYQMPKFAQEPVHPNARDYDTAARRAEVVARTAENVKRLGFTPDIIIGHHGWGELLNLVDVWPSAPILGYFEFYYRTVGQDVGYDPEFPIDSEKFARIRAMNVVNHLALALDQHGQAPTRWQLERYPSWAQRQIKLLPEGARLDICKPDPAARKKPFSIGDFTVQPNEKLVTYVSRNLEPYRGFHTMMRALPRILGARRDVRVIMVGGDDVSYGARLANSTWREHFQRETAGTYDTSRVLLPGQIPYETYRAMLQRSDAHVYLTYPFVASWSLREAMACGCAIIAADVEPVSEFVTHGQTGILTPGLDSEKLSDRVLEVLEDTKLANRLRTGARRYAEATLDMKQHIAAFESRVAELVGDSVKAAPVEAAAAAKPTTRATTAQAAAPVAAPKPVAHAKPATPSKPVTPSKPAAPPKPAATAKPAALGKKAAATKGATKAGAGRAVAKPPVPPGKPKVKPPTKPAPPQIGKSPGARSRA